MGLFDIFSTSFLITIGITILALCLMFLYFSQKFSEQDHKLSSMADLVTTMAHEIHTLKFQHQQVETVQYPSDLATNGTSTLVTKKNTQLIEVSDSDDESDDDESNDDESDDNSDDESDDDDSNVNALNLDSASLASLGEEINLDDIQELESVNSDNIDDNVDDNVDDNIDVNDDTNEVKNVSITLDTLDEIKAISLEEEEQEVHQVETDYKKMSVDKLRHIVVEKGLVVDASKLKKKDLLKLLGLSE